MRRVLITGANKGIGLAIAQGVLDAAPDTHVILGSRDADRGHAAAKALIDVHPAYDGRITVLALDVASDASVQAAAEATHGPLYAIVNNAGVGFAHGGVAEVLNVNTRGPHRVCEAFGPHLDAHGRVVNVSSGAAPMFVAQCTDDVRARFVDPTVSWHDVEGWLAEFAAIAASDGDFARAGYADSEYGMSKACLNSYTMALARAWPDRVVNACTPGLIETDMTRRLATSRGTTTAELGAKPPADGARAPLHLLFGDPGGSGWYFGSDARRSPLDRYRSPGDPPYTGD